MRIPVYTAEGRVTTEAPGRSIRARMSAQPFIAQAQAQGDVVKAVAESADQYASTRYKVLVENQLNEALLGADEALRTRSEELIKSRDYRQALDGDDPIWNRETQEMRSRLRDTVGRDVYALQQFDARFNQAELQTRFRMRGEIDRRIVAEAAAARAQALTRFEQNLAQGGDIAAADLAAREIGINSERWAASGAGNSTALEAQEYAALTRGTYGALENLFNTSSSPSRTIGNIKVALREGDPTLAGPEGLYAYTLLQRLNLEDQARLLRGVGATFDFFDAPTAEEEAARRVAARTGQAAGEQAEALIGQMTGGTPVSMEAIQSVRAQLESVAPAMSPEDFAVAERRVDDLEFVSGFFRTMNRTADLTDVDNAINNVRTGGIANDGVAGVDTDRERMLLDSLESYRTNMARAIEEDPMSWIRSTGAVGAVPNVDISAGAIQSQDTGIANRIAFAEQAQAFYGLPEPTIFGRQDAQNLVSQINQSEFELALGQVGTITAQLGPYAQTGIRELEAAGLAPEFAQAMYISDPVVQRELVQLSGVETAELRAGIAERTMPNDIETELNTQLADYFAAFEAGGGEAAIGIANTEREVAQRLAFARARRSTESAAEIAEGVIADLFPPSENWVREPQQLFIAPRGVNVNEVQIAAERMVSEEMLRSANIAPLDNPMFPEYVDQEVNIAALATRGIWLNNSTGDGVVLHYDFDGQYLPAIRTDGSMYELLFRDAAAQAQQEEQTRMEETFEGMTIAP